MKTLFALSLFALTASALAQESRPLVFAHRGASGYLPEHTLPAKALAYGLGADYLEQDIVLTKDDVPVVLHDIYLDTVTDVAARFPEKKRADGRYYALDLTLAELKQLRVTERFNAKTGQPVYPLRFPAGQSEFHLSTVEEEWQFIQGLNRSMGRNVGVYPELKQPKWHREQGHDISKIVLPLLAKYGYKTKQDLCYLQCFEWAEVKRLRSELGWSGNLIFLMEGKAKGDDGTDFAALSTPAGLKEVATVADGIGPAFSRIVTWPTATAPKVTDLVKNAHAAGLAVHGYTIRRDELPKNCPSVEALHAALFTEAGIDGVFSDFTDLTLAWLKAHPEVRRTR
jgi:glycerophosphoryl diester phosphodiesterase